MKTLIKYLISKMKGTHYVNFNSSNGAVAFSVNSKFANEVKFKLSYVLCFKFCPDSNCLHPLSPNLV